MTCFLSPKAFRILSFSITSVLKIFLHSLYQGTGGSLSFWKLKTFISGKINHFLSRITIKWDVVCPEFILKFSFLFTFLFSLYSLRLQLHLPNISLYLWKSFIFSCFQFSRVFFFFFWTASFQSPFFPPPLLSKYYHVPTSWLVLLETDIFVC